MPLNPYRTGFVASAEEGARLLFRSPGKESWRLDYKPAPSATDIAEKLNPAFYNQQRYTIIECQRELDVARTFPLNVAASSAGFLQGKYGTLRSITLEGFRLADCQNVEDVLVSLQALPSGFVRDPYFGLGINFDIRYIIESIERMDGVFDLRVRKGRGTGLPKVESGSYSISAASFDEIRKRLRRIHAKALDVAADEKYVLTNNALLHAVDPDMFPVAKRRYRKDALSEALGDGLTKTAGLTAGDRKTAARTTSAVAKTMSRSEPKTLLALSRTIETVTLEELIVKMKGMLSKRINEGGWQAFLKDNPFILKMAFGYPVMLIGDQFSVGGRQFSGKGDKISDFAVKAAASGNLALVEIKTPHTDLLEAKTYRGGLFGPDREITGAVNQILDQRFQMQRSLPIMKDASGIYDVESYAIQGLIIAGMAPTEKDKLKSFELFRNGLKSVSIVTYDEMLAKLEFLYEVFRGDSEQEAQLDAAATTDARDLGDQRDLEFDLETDIDLEAEDQAGF